MQVSVESSKGLERKLKINLPAEQFDKAYDERLKSVAKTAKLAGFRPGKVPLNVIRQMYGASIKQEILSDLVQRSYSEAIREKKLKPAGMPQINAQPPEAGKNVEFTATFEVYPEIKLGDFGKLKVVKPLVEINDADVDKMLGKLQQQRAQWDEVNRPAANTDQLLIDFAGTIDDKPFDGGSAQDIRLVLGSGQMVEGFEEQLVGIIPGEERTINVKFPKDYGKEELAGKKAVFKVNCKTVAQQKLPEIDADFVRSFGVEDGNADVLKTRLREHLQRELEQNVKINVKKQVTDGLIALHKITLPNVLVDQEIERMQQQTLQQLGIKENQAAGLNLPKDLYEEEARRHVTLALLFTEIIKEQQIKADAKQVQAYVEQLAAGYQNPQQMVQYYLGNQQLLRQVEALVVEEQTVAKLLEQAKVNDKNMSFDELIEANRKKTA
jgi:trigger factor